MCAVLCFSSGRDAVVFGTNWHRRYVVLANNVLFVYASPKVLTISHMYSVLYCSHDRPYLVCACTVYRT